jgi:hypothetical protein
MSEYEQTVNDLRRYGASGLVVGIVGLVLCAVGFMANRALFYQSWLYALIVWSSITVGCLSVLCLQNSIRAQWGSAIQRFLEAGARMLPFVALLFLPIFLGGMRYLYPWASNGAAASQMAHSKLIYLRMPWFAVRWGIYFLIWSFLAYRLSSWSYQQDVSGDPRLSQKRANLGAPGMMIMLITVTLSMTDWVMSLYPGWDSTIFGFLFTVGQALGGASLMTVIVMALSGSAPWSKIMSERITKDLGNVLLAVFADMVSKSSGRDQFLCHPSSRGLVVDGKRSYFSAVLCSVFPAAFQQTKAHCVDAGIHCRSNIVYEDGGYFLDSNACLPFNALQHAVDGPGGIDGNWRVLGSRAFLSGCLQTSASFV